MSKHEKFIVLFRKYATRIENTVVDDANERIAATQILRDAINEALAA